MLPPILRRLVATPVGIALTVLALLSILSIANVLRPGSVAVLPEGWVGGSGVGGAVRAGAAPKGGECTDVEDGQCAVGEPVVPPPPADDADARLPETYAAYFADLRLPASLRARELAPLARRLTAFLARPALSHSQSAEANTAACPLHLADRLVNPDQLANGLAGWKDVSAEDIFARRAEIVQALADVAERGERLLGTQRGEGREGNEGPSRGIVMTGGNKDTTLRVITVLRHLRRLGNTLPIEVVHFSDEMRDSGQRGEVEALGARLVRARGASKIDGAWKNFQIKGVAMLESSFDEVIYLDSDNTPLRTLEHLFDSPAYVDGGRAAFWPDISKDHAYNAVWRVVGDTCSLNEWTFESGQMVVDKRGNGGLNLAALHIAAAMMAHHEFWFTLCGGDKDTFRWAWRILDIPYARAPRWLSSLGILNQYDGGRFCGHTMLQYDLDATPSAPPRALFVHSNLLKHLGGGLSRGGAYTHVMRMAHDAADDETLNYAHMFVYHGPARGMCLSLEVRDDFAPAHVPQRADQFPLTVPVADMPEFDGFEDAWWDEGGLVGGW